MLKHQHYTLTKVEKVKSQFNHPFKNYTFAQKTYHFISSCDYDNIETVLLSRYHNINNIVASLLARYLAFPKLPTLPLIFYEYHTQMELTRFFTIE